ncbi:hypothetical protein [Brevibacillus porteri]|uniref:hypothetical protein n=1 Tax=Brevibacillus porteri TaxID=2126350 RepID=UPI003D247200
MNWQLNRSGRTGINILSDSGQWIGTLYTSRPDEKVRAIQRSPEMLELLKKSDDPEAKELVRFIEGGERDASRT